MRGRDTPNAAVLSSALVVSALFSGAVFGWSALVKMLKADNAYQSECDNGSTCKEQEGKLAFVYAVGWFCMFAARLPAGVCLDKYGPKLTVALSCLISALGALLFAQKNYVVGFALFAAGGPGVHVGSMHISNLFPARARQILGTFGAFHHMSTFVFTVLAAVVPVLASLSAAFSGMAGMLLILAAVSWLFIQPWQKYAVGDRVESLTSGKWKRGDFLLVSNQSRQGKTKEQDLDMKQTAPWPPAGALGAKEADAGGVELCDAADVELCASREAELAVPEADLCDVELADLRTVELCDAAAVPAAADGDAAVEKHRTGRRTPAGADCSVDVDASVSGPSGRFWLVSRHMLIVILYKTLVLTAMQLFVLVLQYRQEQSGASKRTQNVLNLIFNVLSSFWGIFFGVPVIGPFLDKAPNALRRLSRWTVLLTVLYCILVALSTLWKWPQEAASKQTRSIAARERPFRSNGPGPATVYSGCSICAKP
ncbi:hypothetical protein M885DRAFT_322824 [Pelagophyceae sp. CCMP2097]|nr:hypothetical protein M885DRAFT_322824 [Pelagophyceae sp. CCMP2097]